MQPAIYLKNNDFILSCTTVEARVVAIDLIIDALYGQLSILAGQDEPIQEYTLSDGQTHIKANYRTGKAISDEIDALTFRRNRLVNNFKGRVTAAVDKKNFIGFRY